MAASAAAAELCIALRRIWCSEIVGRGDWLLGHPQCSSPTVVSRWSRREPGHSGRIARAAKRRQRSRRQQGTSFERTYRIALFVGYLASQYHGCSRNVDRDEEATPTIESALRSAIGRAWGDVVKRLAWCSTTERGVHAVENMVILHVSTPRKCEASALKNELLDLEIWLLALANLGVASASLQAYFDKRSIRQRVYTCTVPLLALLPSNAKAVQLEAVNVQSEVRQKLWCILRMLRGQKEEVRSFHNFTSNLGAGDPRALCALQDCRQSWLDLNGGVVAVKLSFAAEQFRSQQVRRMVGAIVAEVSGIEDEGYVASCFSDHMRRTPAAPVEAVCLESLELGLSDWDWRQVVHLDDASVAETKSQISGRIVHEAWPKWLDFVDSLSSGATRVEANQRLSAAARLGSLERLNRALEAGAQVNAVDKYGQTALFMAAWAGHLAVVEVLAASNADLHRPAHGGCSPARAAFASGHHDVVRALQKAGVQDNEISDVHHKRFEDGNVTDNMSISVMIPHDEEHAGAGTVVIDGAFDESFLHRLDLLEQQVPEALKEKASPTARAYFVDADGWVVESISSAVAAAGLTDAEDVMPLMRFLRYSEPGGTLAPHVDMPRTHASGRATSYSFLLYLRDCAAGGETLLLECLDGDDEAAQAGGVAAGDRGTVAAIEPRRGRLLLMPHHCPHAGASTVDVPKLLLRGELLPPVGYASGMSRTGWLGADERD